MFKALCSVTLSALLVFTAVAQTNPGSAPSGAVSSTLVGCIQKAGNTYSLTDETSKVTTQLNGGSLKAGRHVQITGTTSMVNGTEVLNVASVTGIAGACQGPASAGSSYVADDSSRRGKIIGILVITAIVATGAIATVARQGSARGTTNNDAPAVNH